MHTVLSKSIHQDLHELIALAFLGRQVLYVALLFFVSLEVENMVVI